MFPLKNVYKVLFIFLSVFPKFILSQNDTTVIQTLEFSDITKRKGWFIFPSDTNEYQKILMYYTLKCDAATTQDNYACGEWDYTTYTRLYQHQNVNSPYFYYKNTTPEIITYNDAPKYDIHQSYDKFIIYDSTINEYNYILGAGNTITNNLLNTSSKSGKAQYLITATELQNQGLYAGSIDKLEIQAQSQGEILNNVKLKIKSTPLSINIHHRK